MGATARVEKVMTADPVRRIGELGVTLSIPGGRSGKEQSLLEKAVLACPVHRSLLADLRIPVAFEFTP